MQIVSFPAVENQNIDFQNSAPNQKGKEKEWSHFFRELTKVAPTCRFVVQTSLLTRRFHRKLLVVHPRINS